MAVFPNKIALKSSLLATADLVSNLNLDPSIALVPGELIVSRSGGQIFLVAIDNNNVHKRVVSNPPDGDKGDITVSNTGTTWTIDAGAINDAKFSGVLSLAKGGTGSGVRATALNNLLPTQTGNASKVLTTDGTNASWGSASNSLDSLTDVDTSTTPPVNGNALLWNQTLGQWVPGVASTVGDLDDLSDVTISTPLEMQYLVYEAATSQWKNKEVPIWGAPGDGGDFDTGTIATVGNVWPDGGDFGT